MNDHNSALSNSASAPGAEPTPHPYSYDVQAGPPPWHVQPLFGVPHNGDQAPKKRSGTLIAAVVAGVLAIAGGIVTMVLMANQRGGGTGMGLSPSVGTRLEIAAEVCGISGVTSDEGHTMTLSNVAAEDYPGPVSYTELECVLNELDTPQSVRSHMGQTRALDGMQTNEWDDFEALWTYHPDDGINITITEQ